ncbi:MAG: hypothetical protein CMO55_08635 [Verrucomicrobiales bacterium]|nr:hypothetical protein [Verrucomicrobiales bacterium]
MPQQSGTIGSRELMEVFCQSCGRPFETGEGTIGEENCSVCQLGLAGGDPLARSPRGTWKEYGTEEAISMSIETVKKLFPEFEVVKVLGQGGMGTVFLVKQKSLERLVALKMLSAELSANPEFQERFEREAKAMADIQHPNVLTMYEYGMRESRQFLILEYVEGDNLHHLIRTKQFSFEKALRMIIQICEAVHHLHKSGFVHRDLKPGNILVGKDDHVKIADFGLAKLAHASADFTLTRSDIGLGTPHYIAPEQRLNATNSGSKSDVYSLGVLFFEMLTGTLPSGNADQPMKGQPRRYRRLGRTILEALRQEPEARPADVMEFVKAIPKSHASIDHGLSADSARGFRRRMGIVTGCTGILVSSLILVPLINQQKADIAESANVENDVERLRSRYLLPIPELNLPGGSLYEWKASSPESVDQIAPEKSDFLELESKPFFVQSFFGFRANQEVEQLGPPQEKHNIRLATRSFYISTDNHLYRRSDSLGDLDFQFETPVNTGEEVRTIEQGRHFAIALTKENRVHFAATEAVWEKHGNLYREIENTPGIIDIAVWSDTGIALTQHGRPICWNGRFGKVEAGVPPVPLVDIACGVMHFIGLDANGRTYVWPATGKMDQRAEAVLDIPADARENVVRVESDLLMAAVQKSDGIWRAWGNDGGTKLIEKINSIGPARDIVFRPAPEKAVGLIWIGSDQTFSQSEVTP